MRDRKPVVRFVGKTYVLPRTGQRGIPLVSVNTDSVDVEIYRIGDRNLTDTVIGSDFQRNLGRYEVDQLAAERGMPVWKGELAVENTLNKDVTTAFPVDQSVGDLAPGVYVMVAEPRGRSRTITKRWRPSGSSFPISASPLIPVMTASMSSCINWRAPTPRAWWRCGSFRAATRCWPHARRTATVMPCLNRASRAARADLRRRC